MENNKLLIGAQFTERDEFGRDRHIHLELYVVRDITLQQLIEGIQYGLIKLARTAEEHRHIYQKCCEIFEHCAEKTEMGPEGELRFRNITFTSYHVARGDGSSRTERRYAFSVEDTGRSLCDLGFIASSRIIFDATGGFVPRGKLDTSRVIHAFDPNYSETLFFPEYNISTRQLYQFDTTPVQIIPPTDPPQKPNQNLLQMLLPSLLSVGVMLLLRVFMGSSGSGLTMVLMSAAMAVVGLITSILNWKRQLRAYEEDLAKWRMHYAYYMDSLCYGIQERQRADTAKLEKLYPDIITLIQPSGQGIYALKGDIYSRAPQDADFLTFRVGRSDDVASFFEVKGEGKEVVYSDTFFDMTVDSSGFQRLRIYLRDELQGTDGTKENLSSLPGVISRKYAKLQHAPLLYSLKNKGCLGIVDRLVDEPVSKSAYFISRMIFELCYYHSPEHLQFVVFFKNSRTWDHVEQTIHRYKFMPHFRGLFPDKSQFVFDRESAHVVMGTLLTMMHQREGQGQKTVPHIVCIVFEEHGLKEHAFAEYLPTAPADGGPYQNTLGLSFVFAAKYKEHLPAYCDDVVHFEQGQMTLIPRTDVSQRQRFGYRHWTDAPDPKAFFASYNRNVTSALSFLSSIHYAQIAQNGKVPSSVSMYAVAGVQNMDPKALVCEHWGLSGARKLPAVTRSLAVPIGRTETGTAYLDLHEKADGPHMLVAGTTGSGKTETIISYLLGLCMQYRPEELNLLLVDMKGGGFTKRIGHLPHVVGAVTDVDGDENGTSAAYMLGRFLNAMISEIKRRKLLFNRLHVDSIDAYIQACANIDAHIEQKKLTGAEAEYVRKTAQKEKLSHLILVVDEFTELKRFSNENGDLDFMGEITTIARVGRSLGFHIILISQNIEGAITEDIRVNSNARLCLKVATRQASKDMIGTELAASAFMPGNGRAYLLVGTGSKFEYLQSAYSGTGVEDSAPVSITLASKTGAYLPFYRSDRDNLALLERKAEQKKNGTAKTQLEAICEAICEVWQEHQQELSTPHRVFRSPLSACIAWDRSQGTIIDLSKRKQVTQ